MKKQEWKEDDTRKVQSGPEEERDSRSEITRRTFLNRSLIAGAVAGAAVNGLFPFIQTIEVAFGAQAFSFAWISDSLNLRRNCSLAIWGFDAARMVLITSSR